MSISQLVPLKEAEMALLEELDNEDRPIKTGELVKRAIKHFPQKLTPSELQRTTPSGTLWWPGRFRYDLNRLKKKGEAQNTIKGYWGITKLGCQRLGKSIHLANVQSSNLSDYESKYLDWMKEAIDAIKTGDIKATIRTKKGGFTVELGGNNNETQVLVGGR